MRQGARAGSAVVAGLISATVAVVAGLAGLTGCSGSDPAPIDAPTGHPGTAPPTTTARATPTQDPGPAAVAAVQRMFDAYNAMLKSGSSTAYRATFTSACETCLRDARAVEAVWHQGRTIKGGEYSVGRLRVTGRFAPLNTVTVQGAVSGAPADILRNGKVVDHFAAFPSLPVGWSVSMVKGKWLVSRGTVLQ